MRTAALALLALIACGPRESAPPPTLVSNQYDETEVAPHEYGRYPPVEIVDAGQLISTPGFRNDVDAPDRLRAAGIPSSQFEYVFVHIEESGWPPLLSNFDQRIAHPEIVRMLRPRRLSPANDASNNILLVVVASENQHMPEGWRPDVDIFMTFVSSGIETR